jgi:hypothetical protein
MKQEFVQIRDAPMTISKYYLDVPVVNHKMTKSLIQNQDPKSEFQSVSRGGEMGLNTP